MDIRFKITRYNPETDDKPHIQEYTVAADPHDRILDCLNKIKWEQDGTLAFRWSCAHGICGSDALRINGKCGLSCQKLVKDYDTDVITVEPLPGFKVQKDLIVDLEPFYKKIESVRPYLISDHEPGEKETLQDPADSKKLDIAIRCILCACCMGACPVYNDNHEFLGPAPLVWAFRFIFDSRDNRKTERLQAVDYDNGAWACENQFECTRACPKEITVTKYINTIKREIEKELGSKPK